jgi:hypothetical protein
VLPPTELNRVGQGILEADLAVETMAQATVAALAEPLPADVKSLAGEALRNWVRGRVIRRADHRHLPTAALDTLDHRLRTWGSVPILMRDTSCLQIVLTAPSSPEAAATESLFTLLCIDMAVVELGRELRPGWSPWPQQRI